MQAAIPPLATTGTDRVVLGGKLAFCCIGEAKIYAEAEHP